MNRYTTVMNMEIAGFTTKEEIYELLYLGLEARKRQVEEKIASIQAQLGQKPSKIRLDTPKPAPEAKSRRPLSPEARKRIALAQKKRWGAFHRAQAAPKPARKASPGKKLGRPPVRRPAASPEPAQIQ